MSHLRLSTSVTLLSLLLATNALAQDRLVVNGREVGAIGRFGETLGLVDLPITMPLAAGGRYAVDVGAAVDLRTGVRTALLEGRAIADPVRPRVFILRGDGIWIVSLPDGAQRLLAAASAPAVPVDCSYAFSADVLFCAYGRADNRFDLVAVNSVTGAIRPLLVAAEPTFYYPTPLATPDGATMYYVESTGGFSLPVLKAYDVGTGASAVFPGYAGNVIWDDAHERVITTSGQRAQVTTRSGQSLGDAFIGGRCSAIAVSPHTGRLYIALMDYYYGPAWETLNVFDGATYRSLAPTKISPSAERCPSMAVLTAPGPPRALAATVSGHDVSLRWTNVGAASGFLLEAGFASGRTDLTVFVGSSPHVAFVGVPSGVYYVRIRGGNEFGGGRPSAEVRVVVP